MTRSDHASRPPDPRWPRASEWLAAAPDGPLLDLAFLGVPAYRTSLSPTRADRTPAAVRAALARFSTFAASRDVDLSELVAVDRGDIADPDTDEAATIAAVTAATEGAGCWWPAAGTTPSRTPWRAASSATGCAAPGW